MICEKCGLVWSDPLPHSPRAFYEDDYRVSYKGTYHPKPKHILRAGKVAIDRYRKIGRLLSRSLSVLDVGTGGGEFAYLLQTLGHSVSGIEPNKGYAEYSIGEYRLRVDVGFVQYLELPAQGFDIITIWHVLEHTEDPAAVLTKLRTLLKPGGVLVVEVPNIEATCQSPKSTFHEAHIFHFNITTLRKLAEKVGLSEKEHSLSEDGGNITMFIQKTTGTAVVDAQSDGVENSERIAGIVRGHTPLRHYASSHPYSRFLRRVRRSMGEQRELGEFSSGKQLLDKLYRELPAAPEPARHS
ncbi:MAG: class I SAM-dependent methyltransferase [Polaromonas sp.]|nr:class I SAM-dependent methyltransferase [Polaromonas sp.]